MSYIEISVFKYEQMLNNLYSLFILSLMLLARENMRKKMFLCCNISNEWKAYYCSQPVLECNLSQMLDYSFLIFLSAVSVIV